MTTPAGFGIRGISDQLNPTEPTNRMRRKTPASFDEIQKMEDAQQVMRYGGKGGGRKLLFGATATLVGERIAKKVARKYGNKEQQQEAFETLYGRRNRQQSADNDNQSDQSNSVSTITQSNQTSGNKIQQKSFDSLKKSIGRKIERVVKGEIKKVIEELKNTNDNISQVNEVVDRIEKRISPRDVTIGKGKDAQTFRFDPLAPEGREVTLVNESGKSERLASKEGGAQSEYQKVLSKASYFGAKDLQERRENLEEETTAAATKQRTGKIEQLKDEDAKDLAEYLKEELEEVIKTEFAAFSQKVKGGNQQPPQPEAPKGPQNFDEYSKMLDNVEKAQNVMRYGGTGKFRKFLFGATSAVVGERIAKNTARRFGNKEQQEEAFKIMKDPMHGIRGEEVPSANTSQPTLQQTSANTSQPTLEQTQQPAPNAELTNSQKSANEERQQALESESKESQQEFREEIIQKLDKILELVEKNSEGSSSKLKGLLGGAASMLGGAAMRRMAAQGLKFALRRIPLVAAGLTGYEAGSALTEATGASEAIAGGVGSLTGQNAEANKAVKAGEESKSDTLSKLDKKLEGTGYKALGAGKYQGPDGQIYTRGNLPTDVQQKLGGSQVTPDARENATPPEPRKKEEAPVQQLSDENQQLKREQQQAPVIVAPQQTNIQSSQQPQQKSDQTTFIQTRNLEPSVATYVASIFDHPVVHPGIYKM
jgi:hypothetical protein